MAKINHPSLARTTPGPTSMRVAVELIAREPSRCSPTAGGAIVGAEHASRLIDLSCATAAHTFLVPSPRTAPGTAALQHSLRANMPPDPVMPSARGKGHRSRSISSARGVLAISSAQACRSSLNVSYGEQDEV